MRPSRKEQVFLRRRPRVPGAVRSPWARWLASAWLVAAVASPALAQAPLIDARLPHVPGEVLVKLHTDSSLRMQELGRHHGLETVRHNDALGIYLLRGAPTLSASDLAHELGQEPEVEFAELNYLGEGGLVPNDTFFSSQWHHRNTGQTGGAPDADIDSVEGWDLTTGSTSTVVAVLDSGIDSDHPEFVGRIVAGFDFVNNDNDPEDDQSHGTLVTGLLAANAGNNFGVAGVDHRTRVMPVKVLNSQNQGSVMDLVDGLTFAANQGADVISMSLINYPGTSSLANALQLARNSGAILIACAGNGGIGNADVSWPGASPLTISVGATTHTDARASFSGTGSALDLVAPGSSVRTVAYNTAANLSTSFSGCSAATPVAAGVTTLLHGIDPTITHTEVLQVLTSTAEDQVGPPGEDTPGRDDFFGHGRLNLHDAVAILVGSGCVPPPTGDWVVSASCTFQGTASVAANLVVENGATLTLASGSSLGVDLSTHHVRVRQGSRLIVEDGAKID